MAHLFDSYVIVDWSANASPKLGQDSIWIATADHAEALGTLEVRTSNVPTRTAAESDVSSILGQMVRQGRRVLVGFDFPYGYPAGFARKVGALPDRKPWLATWQRLAKEIRDSASNENNRFEVAARLNQAMGLQSGPFWGCPPGAAGPHLNTGGRGRDLSSLRRLRHVETHMRGVQEVWKLFTVGSVGSQALVGIPRVHSLRNSRDLAGVSVVWPFETGFTRDPTGGGRPAIVHAEIWPGVASLPDLGGRVKDDVQVETLARHFASLDSMGELATLFDNPAIGPDAVQECIDEEGWILGATAMARPLSLEAVTLNRDRPRRG